MYPILFFCCGIALIFWKNWRDFGQSIRNKEPLKGPQSINTKKLKDGLIEYGILICGTIFGFYAGYLLDLHRTIRENQVNATSLLISSETRLDIFEGSLMAFSTMYSSADITNSVRDSAVMATYYQNYERKPYYILENITADETLTLLDTTTYYILSELEGNEKSALKVSSDPNLSFSYRRKTLNSALDFDVLRKWAVNVERRLISKQITNDQFNALSTWIVDSCNNLIIGLKSQ